LQVAMREGPDLILCDVQMPRKDGFEVLREVRENSAIATTPFIFLTGNGEKPRMRLAMELGADDFLVKPFTVKELIAAVETRLAKHAKLEQSSEKKLTELSEHLSFALPHEFVTPLNSILGFSSLLLETVTPEQVKEFAGFIRSAGERLQCLVEKFLLYAQLELALANPKHRAAAAASSSTETADIVLAAAQRAMVGCKREGDLQSKVSCLVHPINGAHLARAVQELVENACKFSPAGAPVRLASAAQDGALTIAVSDEGCGLDPEQIKKIGTVLQFDRKVHEQQGTGLGLAIVRRIVDLYNGSLSLESESSRGTTVTIRFPEAPAS
jgi:two-component system, sensor histidine kinase and response regulator